MAFVLSLAIQFCPLTEIWRKCQRSCPDPGTPNPRSKRVFADSIGFDSFLRRKLLSYKTLYHGQSGAIPISAGANHVLPGSTHKDKTSQSIECLFCSGLFPLKPPRDVIRKKEITMPINNKQCKSHQQERGKIIANRLNPSRNKSKTPEFDKNLSGNKAYLHNKESLDPSSLPPSHRRRPIPSATNYAFISHRKAFLSSHQVSFTFPVSYLGSSPFHRNSSPPG